MAGPGGLSPVAARLASAVAAALPDSPVMVALSGGADSAALAWAVSVSSRPARAVSVDHGLPGSSALVEAAAAIAAMLSLEHVVIRVEAASGSETDLRTARLAALEGERRPAEVIATGHTRDDLAETVLGNVLRGSGTAGLAGIPPARRPYVRPMLTLSRAVARTVAGDLGLPFAEDPQNDDRSIRRNRLRLETIPSLAVEYNPSLVAALARLAEAAAADDALLEHRADRVGIVERDGAVLIPAAALQMLPRPVAARAVRRGLRRLRGPHPGESTDVAAVLSAVTGPGVTVGGGIQVSREGPWVALVAAESPVPDPVELSPHGRVHWGEWEVTAGVAAPGVGRFGAMIDRSVGLVVRAPAPSDRIAITGGSKSVGEVLREAGIPGRLRSRWPVVESDGTIVWVAGVRAAPVSDVEASTAVRAVRRRR